MIRCHLARMMGEHKMRIADVARETGLSRATVTLLYKETAQKVDLASIEKLCLLFECQVGELLELTPPLNTLILKVSAHSSIALNDTNKTD
ncbi:helix-turn-helix transcriptional regulator [Dickeya dianthicola]|uniref:helix-turn-helix domain-containing protein n=1 Tax=Dickeya dianthicola TaxID=204039 RepID=UPI001F612554|nr:helix-turn-helix transcriptional regulator [Dickeya dianthicola]MCI4185048.1 helix-turn-helix transcriptional regulator [Dickeya dianthicola]